MTLHANRLRLARYRSNAWLIRFAQPILSGSESTKPLSPSWAYHQIGQFTGTGDHLPIKVKS